MAVIAPGHATSHILLISRGCYQRGVPLIVEHRIALAWSNKQIIPSNQRSDGWHLVRLVTVLFRLVTVLVRLVTVLVSLVTVLVRLVTVLVRLVTVLVRLVTVYAM